MIPITARAVRGDGLPASGAIEFTPVSPGVHDGALRMADTASASISNGVMAPLSLVPGYWKVAVVPGEGLGIRWRTFVIEIPEDSTGIDLATVAPVVEVDGQAIAKGDKGDDGHTPVLAWQGTALAIDDQPPVNLKGDTGDRGPQGERGTDGVDGNNGAPGPANVLSIGTVTSGATASATIQGESPAQTLDLVLPKGDKGDKGDTGAPGGSGLGWRDVTSLIDPARLNTGTRVYLLRTTDMVWWKWKGGFASMGVAMSIPADYQPEHQPWDRPVVNFYRHGSSSSATLGLGGALAWADSLYVVGAATDNATGALLGYPCLRPLPATPLGDPVTP